MNILNLIVNAAQAVTKANPQSDKRMQSEPHEAAIAAPPPAPPQPLYKPIDKGRPAAVAPKRVKTLGSLAREAFGPGAFFNDHFMAGARCSQQILNQILDAAGPLWTAEEIQAQKRDFQIWSQAQRLLDEYCLDNAKFLLRKRLADIGKRVAAGEIPDAPITLDLEHQVGVIRAYRQAVREGLVTLSSRVHARLVKKCEMLRHCAAKLALALGQAEKTSAEEFGLQFEASARLKCLIWFAYIGWQESVGIFFEGTSYFPPTADFFGRVLFEPEACQTADLETETKAMVEASEKDIETHRQFLAQKASDEAAKQSEAKRREIEPLNLENDRIRAEGEAWAKARRAELRQQRQALERGE